MDEKKKEDQEPKPPETPTNPPPMAGYSPPVGAYPAGSMPPGAMHPAMMQPISRPLPKEAKDEKIPLKDRVLMALQSCYDPEIPVNIYELGLIYKWDVNDKDKAVDIDMTLTAPTCPVAESLPPEVEKQVKSLPGVEKVKVALVWEPPWKPDMMSQAAKLKLNLL